MSDIDTKAMQTVRFNTVLIGLLLAAVNAAGPEMFDPALFQFSVAALAASVLLGLATYNESNLFVGADGNFIEDLARGEPNETWDEDLIEAFAGMVSRNRDDLDRNSSPLTLSQLLLASGMIAAILAVGI